MTWIERSILYGLDDMAHNRLLIVDPKTKKTTKVKNYGKRDKRCKCYCRILGRKQ